MKAPVEVVILPTEDETDVVRNTYCFTEAHGNPLRFVPDLDNQNELIERGYEFQHVYITVSQDLERPKDGDWFINEVGELWQHNGKVEPYKGSRKIIATTDLKLKIADFPELENTAYRSLPQVPQSFLKEFVSNPNGNWEVKCEEVPANMFYHKDCDNPECGCKELKLKLNPDNIVTITSASMYSLKQIRLAFQAGARYGYCQRSIMANIGATCEEPSEEDWIKENL